ncbi:MAG: glycerophosphodiester phosphodiesterase [Methanocalculus sp. MSAO_Arc2]|uniref:glycerophosphodiester phosphodiesterase n=1 Tax=Methanocalculus sp. MSAO_Arc2 TaxID=2293855 RepID=UPI000FF4F8D7|nr:MAG: glycerophosphodiester phosphodiesterase [Methanocalculus sp. MSAO_Arc2]
MIIIGHRGARATCPENTIAALREGSRCADYVEIDVRLSRDRVPVVIHDPTLERTTNGTGLVSDYTLPELKALDAGEGEQIPTLAEVFALDHGGCGLVIELKEGGYEDQIAAMVSESMGRGSVSDILIVSFDADCLRHIAQLLPDAEVGYIFRSVEPDPILVAASIPASTILPRFDLVSWELISSARKADLRVIAWTLNTDEEYMAAAQLGVDGMATDDPCHARSFLSNGY